jgi:hypothetical protein
MTSFILENSTSNSVENDSVSRDLGNYFAWFFGALFMRPLIMPYRRSNANARGLSI